MVMAGPVDQETAKKKATDFIAVKMAAKSKQDVKAVNGTALRQRVNKGAKRAKATRDYLHVFNIDGGGFVVVSGDDRTESILGYSPTGTFDPEDLPENLRAFLQEYADGIQYLDDTDFKPVMTKGAAPKKAKASIAALVKTTWDQWAPYNIYMPIYGSDGIERAVTGCGATALAQILNYHQWPKTTPVVIPAYTTETKGTYRAAIPAGTTIDWSSMVNKYTTYIDADKTATNATTSEKAVANLMKICGQALKMDYNLASLGGSSAYNNAAAPALVNYLDYEEETVQYIHRVNYSYSEWQDLIYNELANKRPVFYTGQSNGGGHAFVCDGYDSDDFFHINWGWSGGSDNFFRLRLLNPQEQGAGGSTTNEGYGMGQDATIGIQPNDGTTVTKPVTLSLYGLEFATTTFTRSSSSDNFSISGAFTYYLQNGEGTTTNFNIGLRIVDASGTTKYEGSLYSSELQPGWYTYHNWLPSIGAGWANGTYKLYMLGRKDGTTDWVVAKGMENDPILFTISGNTLTFTAKGFAKVSDLTISGKVTGSLTAGEEQTVTVTVKNNNATLPYRGDIYYKVGSGSVKGAGFLEVDAGKTTEMTFAYTPSTNGTYSVQLYTDRSGSNALGDAFSFTVGEGGDPKEDLTVTAVGVYNSSASRHIVEGGVFRVTGIFKNAGKTTYTGIFAPTLYAYNWDTNKWDEITDKQYSFTIKSGESCTFDTSFDDPKDDAYDYYLVAFWVKIDGNWVYIEDADTDYYKFVNTTGINGVKVEKPAANDGKVFNLNGQQMPNGVNGLKPGLYIINGKKVVIK